MKLRKLEAARRQILTAIHLYFNNDDIVSTHTLAAAAGKIAKDICDAAPDQADSLKAVIAEFVKPEAQKLAWKKFYETANFFKHAEKDPDAVHDFSAEETENVLFIAVYQYRQITKEFTAEMHMFMLWYKLQHPEVFEESPTVYPLATEYFGADKNKFWRVMMPRMKAPNMKGS